MQLPNVLGFIFGVVQMVLYVFYMNKTPVAAAVGKDAGKLPSAADEHVLVNIAKLNPALPERTSGMHPVTQMAAVPARSCAAEAIAPAMLPNRDVVDVFVSRHSPAVHVV
jgi:solute carrier family 50 (sugar transporter)